MKKTIIVFSLLMLVCSASSWGAGLAIPEQGAAAMGMSAAVTARSEDLSSIYYNPAGLKYVQGFELSIGATPISPKHEYSPFSEDKKSFEGQEAESNLYLPPHIYAAWRATDSMVLGLGVFAPFGLGTDWDTEWTGRYASTFGEISTIYVNPTLQYSVTEKLSLGVGVSYIHSSATIERMFDTGSKLAAAGLPVAARSTMYDSKFGIEGDGSAFGFNAGILYDVSDMVDLGASFRSAYDVEYDGDAKFTHKAVLKDIVVPPTMGGTAFNMVSASMPASQSGTATLNMPYVFSAGALFHLNEKWDVSTDVNYTGWLRYEELVLDFDEDKPTDEMVQDKDWENTITLRGGASYDLDEKTVLRFGMMWDNNPVPRETMDPQLPDADRFGISLGAGYTFGKVRIDASYLLLKFMRREKDNGVGFSSDVTGDGLVNRFDVEAAGNYPVANGMYDSRAHLFALTASVMF